MASSLQGPPSVHVPPPYTEYLGAVFPALVTKENLEAMKAFEMRDGDVVLVSYPKSGTNWVHQVVHEILGRKSETSPINMMEFSPPERQQPNHVQLRESPSPRLMGTHLPVQMAPPGLSAPRKNVKVVVTLRNPKDVCVSRFHFDQKNPYHKTPESWKQHAKDFLGGNLFGGYFDHVMGWWQMKVDPHFLFVKYEDMKKEFPSSLKTIAAFLEKELTDEDLARVVTNCSLESMRKNLAKSDSWRKVIVRKGIVGDWKNHFSAEESEKFDQKYREWIAGSGLEFDFQ